MLISTIIHQIYNNKTSFSLKIKLLWLQHFIKLVFLWLLSEMSIIQFLTILFIGIGLSFDSFAVSVSCGLMKREIRFKQAVPIAFSLAFFQSIFPVIGWFAGKTLHTIIYSVDHWIAFGLLAFIGIKMIVEGAKPNGALQNFNPFKKRVILSLSVATSIDALVVGLSFGFLEIPIVFPALIIGAITFLAAMLGMLFGKNIPAKRSKQSLILGGLILFGIGVKVLIEHTFL